MELRHQCVVRKASNGEVWNIVKVRGEGIHFGLDGRVLVGHVD